MTNTFDGMSETVRWRLMVDAAKKGVVAQGYSLARVPGRGLSNIWNVTRNGTTAMASIRTTRDRWIAFPPLDGGAKWKTLDDVETVIVASVDFKDNPKNVEVYIFPAAEVRKRFNAAYAVRVKDGQTVKDNFGMWVGLDRDERGIAASVGSGILDHYKPVSIYPIAELIAENPHSAADHAEPATEETETAATAAAAPGLSTIAEVMAWARDRVAQLADVPAETVKLDLKIGT